MAENQSVVSCVQIAPFGLPVVPDVYINMIGSLNLIFLSGTSSAEPLSNRLHGLDQSGIKSSSFFRQMYCSTKTCSRISSSSLAKLEWKHNTFVSESFNAYSSSALESRKLR